MKAYMTTPWGAGAADVATLCDRVLYRRSLLEDQYSGPWTPGGADYAATVEAQRILGETERIDDDFGLDEWPTAQDAGFIAGNGALALAESLAAFVALDLS